MSLSKYKGYGKLVNKISRAINNSAISHAYIIEGDSCINKVEFVKEFVKAVLCEEEPGNGCDNCVICRKIDHDNYEDLYYIGADEISVKDAKIIGLQNKLKNRPSAGERNIAIIDDADTLTPRAQNRLLKTLEEPSPGTIIFLLVENAENLLQTINSRCITYRLGNFFEEVDVAKMDFASKIINMVMDGEYFIDIKNQLDKNIKDRKAALGLIDAIERQYRVYLVDEGLGLIKKEKVISNVRYIEEARRDILIHVNYKYALRNMILKIGK